MTDHTITPVAAGDLTKESVDAETYAELLQFYAQHMQLLDSGEAEEWAARFTPDGVFEQNVKPEPWQGRERIAQSMRKGVDRLAERGVVRRHWFGMVTAGRQDDGRVRTRYYAVVFETPPGGKASVYLSTTGEDVLTKSEDGWLVSYRYVTHDGAS